MGNEIERIERERAMEKMLRVILDDVREIKKRVMKTSGKKEEEDKE